MVSATVVSAIIFPLYIISLVFMTAPSWIAYVDPGRAASRSDSVCFTCPMDDNSCTGSEFAVWDGPPPNGDAELCTSDADCVSELKNCGAFCDADGLCAVAVELPCNVEDANLQCRVLSGYSNLMLDPISNSLGETFPAQLEKSKFAFQVGLPSDNTVNRPGGSSQYNNLAGQGVGAPRWNHWFYWFLPLFLSLIALTMADGALSPTAFYAQQFFAVAGFAGAAVNALWVFVRLMVALSAASNVSWGLEANLGTRGYQLRNALGLYMFGFFLVFLTSLLVFAFAISVVRRDVPLPQPVHSAPSSPRNRKNSHSRGRGQSTYSPQEDATELNQY